MKTRILILTFLVAMLISCSAIKSSKFKSADMGKSISYALPKTFIDVMVTVERKEIIPSKFQDFALCRGIISKKVDSSVTFSVKSIKTDIGSWLDEKNIFQTRVVDGFLNKNEFIVNYNLAGELTKGDYKSRNIGLNLLASTIEFGTGLFLPSAMASPNNKDLKNCFEENSISKKDSTLIKELISKLEIYNGDLAKIRTNGDYYQLSIMNAQIERTKKERDELLSKFFTHQTKKKTEKLFFRIDPSSLACHDKKQNKFVYLQKELFSMVSKNGGLIENDDLKNQVWSRKLFLNNKNNEVNNETKIFIKLGKINNLYAKTISSKDEIVDKASFYYRVPSTNSIFVFKQINKENKPTEELLYVKRDVLLTQFGRVIGAPRNLGDVNFELHPTIGSLKSIGGKSSSVDLEQLNTLKSQILSSNKAVKSDADVNKEIEKLKKENELLELRKKNEELKNNSDKDSEEEP